MSTNPTTGDDAINGLRDLFGAVAVSMHKDYKPKDIKTLMAQASSLVAGLRHQISTHIIHGDIKPQNILAGDSGAVLSDYGSSKVISEICSLMNKEFTMENELYKDGMKRAVDALRSKNETRIQSVYSSCAPQIEVLKRWHILGVEKEHQSTANKLLKAMHLTKSSPKELTVVTDDAKLRTLSNYLNTSFLPVKSIGYACPKYSRAICDYFWRCEKDNLERACNAFDIRALGIALYEIFTATEPPLGEKDNPDYYKKMQTDLTELHLPEQACRLIRQMAEPLPDFDTTSGKAFTVPCSDRELQTLQELLLKESLI